MLNILKMAEDGRRLDSYLRSIWKHRGNSMITKANCLACAVKAIPGEVAGAQTTVSRWCPQHAIFVILTVDCMQPFF